MSEELHPEAVAALVRGLSAYMKAVPKQELPRRLAPIATFDPRRLKRHQATLLGVLEDDAFRARVRAWVDEEPKGIAKRDAEALRLFSERPSGWEEALAQRFPSRRRGEEPGAEKAALAAGLERERDKTRRAREDARKAKEGAARALRERDAEIARLRSRADELLAAVERAERQVALTGERAERDAERLEDERRRARRSVERSERARDQARADLKQARREIRELKSKIADLEQDLEQRLAPPPRDASPRASGPPTRRPVLKPPPGLPADAPEALEAWLSGRDVHVLIDGYNVTKRADGGWPEAPLERQRELLVQAVEALARRRGCKATIVFDGADVPPGGTRPTRGPVRVEYSAPAAEEGERDRADRHLIRLLTGMPAYPVVVVTDDRGLQERAAELRATVANSGQLLSLLR